jgi:hypothetical protein
MYNGLADDGSHKETRLHDFTEYQHIKLEASYPATFNFQQQTNQLSANNHNIDSYQKLITQFSLPNSKNPTPLSQGDAETRKPEPSQHRKRQGARRRRRQ